MKREIYDDLSKIITAALEADDDDPADKRTVKDEWRSVAKITQESEIGRAHV